MKGFLIALGCVLAAGAGQAETWRVTSPDGRTAVEISREDEALPVYQVARDGKTFIAPSALGLRTDVAGFGAKGFAAPAVSRRSVDEVYAIVLGKAKTAPDRFNELRLDFSETTGAGRIGLVFRVYDDGVALRYELPAQAASGIYGERTEFAFAADFDCWGLNIGQFHSAHEGEFDPVRASMIRPHNLYDSPLVCKTGNGEGVFALAEADVEHYPAGFYTRKADNGLGVAVRLPPRTDADLTQLYVAKISKSEAPFRTPWRVIMTGDSPRALAGSNLIATLGAPSRVADTTWIKGGKSAWDWWNGFNAPVETPGINTATYLAYIDFAHEMGLEYILIDEGWYQGSSTRPRKGSDVTKPIAAVDMPAILDYARARGIGVFVWVQWAQLDWQMDEALAAYARWGVKGIKIDFMDRSDQDMVDYYHRVLSKAAAQRLMVNLHGAYAPNGLVRTYPNYVTQEGVLGAEYNKWTRRITARHNVTLPYTRMILGPIDYTPGGFAHRTPQTFEIHENRPLTQTTRGQAVAMYVVYDSPLVMVSDAPQAYRKADGSWEDGVDFLREVPVTWDETRVLQGDIGEYIVTARRKGEVWYVGAMTNETGRTVDVPLDFLPEGAYQARLWQDGETISQLEVSGRAVQRTGALKLVLAPSGGGVAVLRPAHTGGRTPES